MSDSELRISADTAPGHIEERIGVGKDEKLRNSSRRENYLRRFTRVMTGEGVDLTLHPTRADTNFSQEPPRIRIPAPPDGFGQPITSIRRRVYDMLIQETISLHEAGHVLYTDWRSFEERVEDVDEEYRPIFKQTWNVLEDGAIEQQLRGEFNCEEELSITNSNLAEQKNYGTEIEAGKYLYTFHAAVSLALSDLCIINSGTLDKLLDSANTNHVFADEDDKPLFEDFLPRVEDVAVEYLSEPSGKERTEVLWDFWQDYKDKLDDAEVGGMQSAKNMEGEAYFPVKGGDAKDGYSLRGMSEDNKDSEYEATDIPSAEELEELMSAGQEDGEEGDEGEDGDEISSAGGDIQDAEEAEEEVKERFEEEVRREAQEESGAMLDEAMEYQDLLSEFDAGSGAGDTELQELEVGIADENDDWNVSRWRDIKRRSRIIEETLRRRLRREKRSKVKRKRRRGSFDSSRMVNAARGNHRVFKKEKDQSEKDYSCMVVVDRSGSMKGGKIRMAEKGAGAFLMALESLGIEVSMIDLFRNTPRLVVPLGGRVEEQRPRLFTGERAGGTPMSDMISLAKERLERESSSFPFMIVITDGLPARPDEYKDALDSANFPVIGVNIGDSKSKVNAEEFFHRQTDVQSENELLSKLERLAEEVLI